MHVEQLCHARAADPLFLQIRCERPVHLAPGRAQRDVPSLSPSLVHADVYVGGGSWRRQAVAGLSCSEPSREQFDYLAIAALGVCDPFSVGDGGGSVRVRVAEHQCNVARR